MPHLAVQIYSNSALPFLGSKINYGQIQLDNRRIPKAPNEIISVMAGVTSINSCKSLRNFNINNPEDYRAN
jgi:hypothetical protein